MNPRTQILTAIALAAAALVTSATGCELIASVDREKISGSGGGGAGTGGSGGSTTTTSSGGSGGTMATGGGGSMSTGGGGSMAMCGAGVTKCSAPTDCPTPTDECLQATCDVGCCATTNRPDMTPTATGQMTGDCQVQVCDGTGQKKLVADSADKPAPSDACHTVACVGTSPMESPAMAGTACAFDNGKVCDANGACVGCLKDADCTVAANPICDMASHTCVPATCNDGMKNGSETATDCGGSCGPCVDGLACNMGSDCKSKVCTGSICQVPTCGDGQKNGTETDVDCGGPCAAAPTNKTCAVNLGCTAPTDCATGACNGTTCVFKAAGVLCNNNGECGAAGSNLCVDGVCCNTSCTAGCQACTTAKKGGGGNGVCGNVAANTDPDSDCTDQGIASCGDNGFCNGSGACAKYPVNSSCGASACVGNTLTPQVCNATNMCAAGAATTCGNGLKCNAGGTACLSACAADTDCASANSFCQNPGANGVCVAKKANGAVCAAANECVTPNCIDGVCCNNACGTTCQACNVAGSLGTCSNVPAGGTDSTCASPNVCDTGACVACASDAQCTTAGLTHCKTATHTCVECVTNAQCASGVCAANNTCSAPACNDGVQNGTETGVDCGGTCLACNGATCTTGSQCTSATCSPVSGTCVANVNGCTLATALDLTGMAGTTITFDNGNFTYSPKCIKVTAGTVVTFNGSFAGHPLEGGEVVGGVENAAASGPFIPVTNTGTTKNFTMSATGTFPYYCQPHGTIGMNGAIFVVP